jgi:hypothetical protein
LPSDASHHPGPWEVSLPIALLPLSANDQTCSSSRSSCRFDRRWFVVHKPILVPEGLVRPPFIVPRS